MVGVQKCFNFQDCKYCLTRMMDCRKPSAGFIDNLKTDLLKDGMKVSREKGPDRDYHKIDLERSYLLRKRSKIWI